MGPWKTEQDQPMHGGRQLAASTTAKDSLHMCPSNKKVDSLNMHSNDSFGTFGVAGRNSGSGVVGTKKL